MRSARRLATWVLAAASILFAAAPGARAQDLEDARRAGWVGERPDGYVGVVAVEAPAWARQLADDVNAKRKLKYAEIAKQNGTAVEAVAALAGAKLIERTPPGQYVLGADGRWQLK